MVGKLRIGAFAATVGVAAALLLPAGGSAGDPGLTLGLSPSASLVDGVYVVMQATATCDPSYAPSMDYGGMYLWVIQNGKTEEEQVAGEGDAGPLVCDGLPHTYTTQVFPQAWPRDTALPFKAGPAVLGGAAYVSTKTGQLFTTDWVQIDTHVGGAPPAIGTPTTDLALAVEPARLGRDGGVTLSVEATCDDAYAGDTIGGSMEIDQKTPAGIAAGSAGGESQPLLCDGRPHGYTVGTAYPSVATVPFKPGLATVLPWFVISTSDGTVLQNVSSGWSSLVIKG